MKKKSIITVIAVCLLVTLCSQNAVAANRKHSDYTMYVVKFLDYDGSKLFESVYLKGERVMYPDDPERRSDETYAYRFKEWTPEVKEIVEEDMTYTAVYEQIPIEDAVNISEPEDPILADSPKNHGGRESSSVSSTSDDITVVKLNGENVLHEEYLPEGNEEELSEDTGESETVIEESEEMLTEVEAEDASTEVSLTAEEETIMSPDEEVKDFESSEDKKTKEKAENENPAEIIEDKTENENPAEIIEDKTENEAAEETVNGGKIFLYLLLPILAGYIFKRVFDKKR